MDRELDVDELRALRRKAKLATLAALDALGGSATRSAIHDHAVAHGGFDLRETTAPAAEKWRGKHASRLDHELSWTLTNLKRDGLLINPRRGVWALAGAACEAPAPVAAPVVATRLEQLRAMPYREYLRTPEWRETRAAALVRAGHACSLEASHIARLEVHHRTYDRLGAELPQDLTVLCHDCHVVHHRVNGRPGPRAARTSSVAPPALPPTPGTLYVPAAWDPPPAPKRSLLRRLLRA